MLVRLATRGALLRFAAFGSLTSLAILMGAACSPARTNVVLVSLDTCRADRLGLYGYERPTSANLDRFASEAVVFEDCLAQSTATAPSHMSLFTGHYVQRHGLRANGQAASPPYTLASILRAAGWRTAAFTGSGSLQGIYGHDKGFEVFDTGPAVRHRKYTNATRNLPDVLPHALDWLDAHADEPFFLFVHGYDTHCPFDPLPVWARGFVDPASDDGSLREACGITGFQPYLQRPDWIGSPEYELLNSLYDAELRGADDAVGRLFDALRERGLLDQTLVVFTSDHGEVLGQHDWVGHTRLWEEEIRVPLLMRFPAADHAGRLTLPTQHVDLIPTLLAYLELEPPPGLQGVDLMPHIRGASDAVDLEERMRLCQIGQLSAVRFGRRHKFVLGKDRRAEYAGGLLVDLVDDPGEEVNLLESAAGRERYEALVQRFAEWSREASHDDLLYRSIEQVLSEEELADTQQMLQALGYVDEPDEN